MMEAMQESQLSLEAYEMVVQHQMGNLIAEHRQRKSPRKKRRRYRRGALYILHCTEGLIYHHGRHTTAMRWNEIESIWRSIFDSRPTGDLQKMDHMCGLRWRNKKYGFGTNLERASELGRAIEREVTRCQIASHWQRIQQGEGLRFGPLRISRAGMYKGAKFVLWEQVSHVHIWQGVVAITRDGVPQKWPLVRVSFIPNCFLFVALLHLLVEDRVSYEPPEYIFKDYFFAFLLRLLRWIFIRAE